MVQVDGPEGRMKHSGRRMEWDKVELAVAVAAGLVGTCYLPRLSRDTNRGFDL